MDLCIAIERAQKADKDTVLKSPNTVFSLVKGLMSNLPQMEVICDGISKHNSRKWEYYFTLDDSELPRKMVCYLED